MSANKNLNTVTLKELTDIPGIGLKKASAIITHREKKGGFSNLGEIEDVPGISINEVTPIC